MAPPTTITIERRMSDGQEGTITIAILVSIGTATIIALLAVVILVVRRRRKDKSEDIPYGVPSPFRTQNTKVSYSSVNPLLKGEWDFGEKFVPPKRQFTDEVTREDRDALSNNPNGLYRVPSAHTFNPPTPTASSYCLPQGFDTNSVSDHHHHHHRAASFAAANERPPLPPLPRLTIPDYPGYLQTQHHAAVDEESSPTQPLSESSSSSSLYSQATAEAALARHGYFEVPLSQEIAYDHSRSEEELHRGQTQVVGSLLKARAQRNPNGLMREGSQVSHIERTGSIRSVASIHHDNRPYAKRYRSKKNKTSQIDEMEIVREVSEAGSLRSPTESIHPAHRERGYSVQAPPPVAVSRFPQLLRAF